MFVYTLRRIMLSIPVLFAVLLITFTLGFYGPGDPLTIFLGEDFIPDEEVLQRLRKLHGLDRPFWVQFTDYIVGLVQGDFGKSLHGTKRPIIDIMRTTMPISFQLGVAASILLIVTGIPMGAIAAVKQNTWIDYIIISFSISVRSVPVFVMAPMMLIVLVLWLDLMKVPVGWDGIFSQKAIIPVFLMAVGLLLGVVRLMRQGILDTIEQNYVRTARSKGLKERMVVTRHIIKNAMTPVLTAMGLTVAGLITGAFFVELIFGIPGFAGAGIAAFQGRDYPMILAATLVGALLIITANLLVDLGYGLLDPRVRLE